MTNSVLQQSAKRGNPNLALLAAVWANILSWLYRTFWPFRVSRLTPKLKVEREGDDPIDGDGVTKCICISRPGGLEQLRLIHLKPGYATCGYNVQMNNPFYLVKKPSDLPPDCVLLTVEAFSVNYADCCIRWGLYESANHFVGYPIVPGFDVAGRVAMVGLHVSELKMGEEVFGCTLFGAYSSRVVNPARQLRQRPVLLTPVQAAALPTVALTALYALHLAGHYPDDGLSSKRSNRSVLVHSAAGGVGSMSTQMAKILKLSPIVGIVGRSAKVYAAKRLGCKVVVDKSACDWRDVARQASPSGFTTILDPNGVSTLQDSYNLLAPTGRLVVFGFHSNLPMGRDMLSPLQWLKMAYRMRSMPKIDFMDLTVSNKSVLAFNLSFFGQEIELVSQLLDQVLTWVQADLLQCPRVVDMTMDQIAQAHELIQSGKSIGKIVLTTKIVATPGSDSGYK